MSVIGSVIGSVIKPVIGSVISAGDDTALPTFQVFDIPSDVESAYGSTRYGVKISQSGTAQYDSLVIQDDNPNTDTSNTLRYMQVSNHITKLRSDDPFDVEVTMLAGTPITDVVIKPLALNITPVINGDKVTFTVPGPYHVTVQINESTEEYSDNTTIGPFTKRIVKHPLFIEARSIETDVPADDDPTYTIYEPGITTVGLNQALANGDKVYFKPWAVVKIGYVASQADPSNIHVHGNGVITHDGLSATGSGWVDHVFDFTGNSVGGGVSSNGTGNILDGITIFAPLRAAIVCYNAVTCKQMSMYSWLHQQDGITAGEGSVGESWNFVKTRDDQFKIYYQNQTWEQLIIWQMSSGSPAKFGWNLSSNVQNFLVEDMTLIESDVFNSYSTEQETEGDGPEYYDTSALFACMGINSTGSVTDVVFNNITVDTPYLHRFMGVRFQSFQGGQYWGNPDADVVFSGLVVNNLSLLAAPPAKSFIYANQGGSAENVIFKNVTVDGEAVSAYDLFPCANFTPGITLADDGLGGTVSKVIFSPRNFSEIAAAGTQYFDIGASTTADRIVLDVYPVDGNTGLPTGVPSVTDYEMQTLDYTLSGGSIQYVGRNGSDYFDGYISNVKIYNGSDLLIDSPLDEDWTVNAKARNRAAVIAVDSGTAPTTTNSPWVSNGDGTYSIDGSQGGNTNLYYQNVFTLDNVYLLIITVSGSTAGGVRPYSSDINSETVTSGNGTFEFEFTPSSNDDINIQANSDFDGTVEFQIIDVTDVPAYLTAVNITSADAESFDYDETTTPDEWLNDDESVVLPLTEGYGNDFVFVMRTTGASETVTIPCQNVGTFNAVIDWGDGQTSDITAYNDADLSHVYAAAGDHTIRISGAFPNIYFNNGGHKNKLRKVIQLGDVGWVSFFRSFSGCFSSGVYDSDYFTSAPCNTSSATDMRLMMNAWSSVTSPPDLTGFDTSSVTDMSFMMSEWTSMTSPPDLTGFDTSSVTDMQAMMYRWTSMTSPPDLTGFDTSSVTNMVSMIREWTSMTVGSIGVDGFDLSSLTNVTNFANGSAFTTVAYDEILVAWADEVSAHSITGSSFHFGNSTYTGSSAASTARAAIVSAGNTITDGGIA